MAAGRPAPRSSSLVITLVVALAGFGALLGMSPVASADTYVSGWITADQTWGLTETVYVLYGNVTVKPGATLTILEKTTVRFDPGTSLFVEGGLVAQGAQTGPGDVIYFQVNSTNDNASPAMGIQFNATSFGTVTASSFSKLESCVRVRDASPTLTFNLANGVGTCFQLVRSAALVTDNSIDGATRGILLNDSSASVLRNTILNVGLGIRAEVGGSPVIDGNWIDGVTEAPAIGIHVKSGVTADVRNNDVMNVVAKDGAPGKSAAPQGGPGGAAYGIYVEAAASAVLRGNDVRDIRGGRGGDGVPNPPGPGGKGGDGGGASGIAVWNTAGTIVENSTISSIGGGAGGLGGPDGGPGGKGGSALGIQGYGSAGVSLRFNDLSGIRAGPGGSGGSGAMPSNGGSGGNSFGLSLQNCPDASVRGNDLFDIQGGTGGISMSPGVGAGGWGGDSHGVGVFAAGGPTTFVESNTVSLLLGGNGQFGGTTGGDGGNATGLIVSGKLDGGTNTTVVRLNSVDSVDGGIGGGGGTTAGSGGFARGVSIFRLRLDSYRNAVTNVGGGNGGISGSGTGDGRGGDAVAYEAFYVSRGTSVKDLIDTVTRGVGGPSATMIAYAIGYVLDGNPSVYTRLTVENGTILNVETRDFHVATQAMGTTINTPFSVANLVVESPASLTVRNYLGIDTFWPNGVTPVPGSRFAVEDGAVLAWDVTTLTGSERWLLVTDRVYENSNVPTENVTKVTVTYPPYVFLASPRFVDMSSTHTETFLMDDTTAPSSIASPLPAYSPASFPVSYTATDGNGTGLDTVQLWYRRDAGPWTLDQTQPGAPSGTFPFTATGGTGVYAFFTIATDLDGNVEPAPAGNDTWTNVDLTAPGSHVNPLPPVTASASFAVDWEPDPGVTDIASYTVQYNHDGAGWVVWLADTTLTTSTFTASPPAGVYAFRSIAKDQAGNIESPPPTNDTWTFVDVSGPYSQVTALATWQTSLLFLVEWTGSPTAVSYRIDVDDDGGGWSVWIPSTASTSATFTGVDGHTYAFRSIASDGLGNTESPPPTNDTWTIVDVSPPAGEVLPLPAYTSTANFLVSWQPEAGVTDIASYRIDVRDDGGPWTTWIASTSLTSGTYNGQDGHTYDFRATATDFAGNVEPVTPTAEATTTVDTTRPASTVSALPAYHTVLTFAVAWGPEPGVTDIASYRIDVRDNAGPWTTWIASTTLTSSNYTGQAAHAYGFRSVATDNAGNQESPPPSADASTTLDLTPPATSFSVSGTVGANGWYTSPATVTLTAMDATSGVASTTYRVDNGSWSTYTAPFLLLDGTHTLDFYSTDNAGLSETPQATAIRVDATPPSTSASLTGTAGANGWYTSSVSVELNATDGASGVASTSYRVDGGTWFSYSGPFIVSGDDAHIVEFQSSDLAGLTETVRTIPVNIDTSAPSASLSPSGTLGTNGWYTSDITVTVIGSDPTSGIANYTYRVDGGSWQAYLGPVLVSGDGNHTFEAYATNMAGISGSSAVQSLKVDTVRPTATASVAGTMGGNGWYTGAATVTLTAGDAMSGVASRSYRIDGGGWTSYVGPFSMPGDGAFTVEVRATDNAGLQETPGALTVRVDRAPPVSSHALTGTLGPKGWYTTAVEVALSSSDAASGVDALRYRYQGGSWTPYTVPIVVASDGVETVEYYGVDLAGNAEAPRSVELQVDLFPPTVESLTPKGTGIARDAAVVVAFTEPMDKASVESAFLVTPAVTGTFSWSPDGATLTFRPDLPFEVGTQYTVSIGSTATDRAGHPLTPVTSMFATASTGTPGGENPSVNLPSWILPLALILAAALVAGLVVARRVLVGRKSEEDKGSIDDVFMLYRRDGILIKHETRRLKPDIDSDILTGMLTAVQSFVKDTFRGEEGELDQMTFGAMNILLARGGYLVLAAIVTGNDTAKMSLQLRKCILEMEDLHGSELDEWDGDMALAKILRPYIRKLINGEYA